MERGALFGIKREKFKGGTPMKKSSTEVMEKSCEKGGGTRCLRNEVRKMVQKFMENDFRGGEKVNEVPAA